MKRLLPLIIAIFAAACTTPRTDLVEVPLPTMPAPTATPSPDAAAFIGAQSTLAVVTLQAGQTATAIASTAQARDQQATQAAAAQTATAAPMAATMTALPIAAAQAALAATNSAATATAVWRGVELDRVTATARAQATADFYAAMERAAQATAAAEARKRDAATADFFAVALKAFGMGIVGGALIFGAVWIWKWIHIWEVRKSIINTRVGTLVLDPKKPYLLQPPQPVPIPPDAPPGPLDDTVIDADANGEPDDLTPPRPAHAEETPRTLAVKFLLDCFRYQQAEPTWPRNRIPGWRKFVEADFGDFATGEKWSEARKILDPYLTHKGGGLVTAEPYTSVQALYQAIQYGKIALS